MVSRELFGESGYELATDPDASANPNPNSNSESSSNTDTSSAAGASAGERFFEPAISAALTYDLGRSGG